MTRSMTVTCHWVEGALSRYLDGELSPRPAGQLARHLDDCASCREQRASEEELLVGTLEILSPGEPSPQLEDRLRTSLVAAAGPGSAGPGSAGPGSAGPGSAGLTSAGPWRWIEGVAALVIVSLGLWALFSLSSSPASPHSSSANNDRFATNDSFPTNDRLATHGLATHGLAPHDSNVELALPEDLPAVVRYALPENIVPAGLVPVRFRRDIDGDGESGLSDTQMLIAHMRDGTALPCAEAADLDGDDRVTPQDVVAHFRAWTLDAPPMVEPRSDEEQPCSELACL